MRMNIDEMPMKWRTEFMARVKDQRRDLADDVRVSPCCPPASECRRGAAGSAARTSCWHNASQVSTAPLRQVPQRLVSQPVEPTGLHSIFKLPVPGVGIELQEPGPKTRTLL